MQLFQLDIERSKGFQIIKSLDFLYQGILDTEWLISLRTFMERTSGTVLFKASLSKKWLFDILYKFYPLI